MNYTSRWSLVYVPGLRLLLFLSQVVTRFTGLCCVWSVDHEYMTTSHVTEEASRRKPGTVPR
jgi:hypothetical protein